tara:strand:- start:2323 stop:3165 length:843 start_codon:yes stop_codon:yes gene_type:complete
MPFLGVQPSRGLVGTAGIDADAVTNAKIADDQIDSEHYVDGSIDTAHIAANAIDGTLTKDALIADFSDVTITASDLIMYGDATDSNNTKRDTVQGILDLAGGGAWAVISRNAPTSASGTVDMTWSADDATSYDVIKVICWSVLNSTDNVDVHTRAQHSASTWLTSSSNYRYVSRYHKDDGGIANSNSTGATTSVQVADASSSANPLNTTEYSVEYTIYGPANGTPHPVHWIMSIETAAGRAQDSRGVFLVETSSNLTGLRIYTSSGNIAVGYTIIGLKQS